MQSRSVLLRSTKDHSCTGSPSTGIFSPGSGIVAEHESSPTRFSAWVNYDNEETTSHFRSLPQQEVDVISCDYQIIPPEEMNDASSSTDPFINSSHRGPLIYFPPSDSSSLPQHFSPDDPTFDKNQLDILSSNSSEATITPSYYKMFANQSPATLDPFVDVKDPEGHQTESRHTKASLSGEPSFLRPRL